MSLESWLPQAQQLELGRRARVDHDCGAGRTLHISRDERGLHAWCFRCSDKGWQPPAPIPLADRIKALTAAAEADQAAPLDPGKLPEPRLPWSKWPEQARLWLLKAGLGAHDAGTMGAYYHPPTKRVVLPVYGAGSVLFWQARSIDGRQPKYLAPRSPASGVVPQWGSAGRITLVEDLLSCYKVGSTGGCEAWCLMGTSLKMHTLAKLLQAKKPVAIWLDPDAAGKRAAQKVVSALSVFDIRAKIIVSTKDPKLLHRGAIKELLC